VLVKHWSFGGLYLGNKKKTSEEKALATRDLKVSASTSKDQQ
jgi:hypothetical protein